MTANRFKFGAGVAAALFVLAVLRFGSAESEPKAKKETDDKSKPAATERADDERAIRASAEQFVKAFNAGDAKAAAAEFLPKAEYLNADGEAFEGRDAIEKDLVAFFKEFPKAKIEMQIDSIRFVGPRVAIEEGHTAVTRERGKPPIRQSYVAVDILTDGEWQLASVREMPDEDDDEPMTPHERLEPLAWLVGNWMDESDDGVVTTSCRWTEDGNYLLQDFLLEVAGHRAVSGQQRIGWDPVAGHIKSWVFDSQGGHSEGLWTQVDDHWVVKAQGYRPDGTVGSATNIYTPRNQDSYIFASTSRLVGDEAEPEFSVVVVRRPPAPGAKRAIEDGPSEKVKQPRK